MLDRDQNVLLTSWEKIQIIYCLAKLLSSFEILQRHCVGEPSEKFLLDLNLRETIFCLDFLTCPQHTLGAKNTAL